MSKEIADVRKEEIINACEKLYENTSFNDISIKTISELTTFSRPSIYNYFNTKEEIFLAITTKEYNKWIVDLNNIYDKKSMTKEEFSSELAYSLEKRKKLLELISVNMYDMEENSSIESVTEFKIAYGNAMKVISECLIKFFDMSEERIEYFLYSFFPFIVGVYPFAEITDKKREAMKNANINYKYYSLYEILNIGISNMLK